MKAQETLLHSWFRRVLVASGCRCETAQLLPAFSQRGQPPCGRPHRYRGTTWFLLPCCSELGALDLLLFQPEMDLELFWCQTLQPSRRIRTPRESCAVMCLRRLSTAITCAADSRLVRCDVCDHVTCRLPWGVDYWLLAERSATVQRVDPVPLHVQDPLHHAYSIEPCSRVSSREGCSRSRFGSIAWDRAPSRSGPSRHSERR